MIRVHTIEEPSGPAHACRVGVLTLARAEKRNALTPAMLGAMLDGIATLGREHHALLIEGEGDVFCAGFDLSLCQTDDGALEAMLRGLAGVVGALRACPCPVVIGAHGAAIAGGCAMLAGADVVVTNDAAKLGYPVVRLGISPAVSAPTLRLALGDGAARARLLDTQLIDGATAVRLGLAHASLPSVQACRDEARRIALELARKPAHAMTATKRWLNRVDGSDRPERLEAGLLASLGLVGGAEEKTLLPQAFGR